MEFFTLLFDVTCTLFYGSSTRHSLPLHLLHKKVSLAQWNVESYPAMLSLQARSQDFSWGGGGAYLKNRDQIINIRTIHYASSADIQRRVSNFNSNYSGQPLMVQENLASAEGARR